MTERRYRAGDSVEDVCRACKIDRMHTVIVADGDGRPIRVSCGYCDSEHNYRGGPASARPESVASSGGQARGTRSQVASRVDAPFPLVSDRERIAPRMSPEQTAGADLEMLLRRIIREETGLTPVAGLNFAAATLPMGAWTIHRQSRFSGRRDSCARCRSSRTRRAADGPIRPRR